MKTLLIDIETSPNIAHVWGLFKQNVGLNQLMDSSRTMCFAAKWLGDTKVIFHKEKSGGDNLAAVDAAWELLDEADAVIHYNGARFDIPTLNKEFVQRSYTPPAPYKQIDLLQVAKKRFRFPSNKLDYVARAFNIDGKVKHIGHELWVKCMAGDKKAWEMMKEYNVQDVNLLEEVYERMLPWISNHPNHALFSDGSEMVCTNCGSVSLQSRGVAHTKIMSYRRYWCTECGTWLRSRYSEATKEQRENIIVQAL